MNSLSFRSLLPAILLFPLLAQSASATIINGTQTLDVNGVDGSISAYNQSTVTTFPTAQVGSLHLYDSSTLTVNGGSMASIVQRNTTTSTINGGTVSWLWMYDNSISSLNQLTQLSWLLVSGASQVNIYGSDFSYTLGRLSGNWTDGSAFSFWALEDTDLYQGNIGNILPDNIVLHSVRASVPEPSSLALLLTGGLLWFRKRRRL